MKNDNDGETAGQKITLALLDIIGSIAYKTIECADFLARKQRVFYLETKFALLKKGDMIITTEEVRLFRTTTVVCDDNTRVEFVVVPPNTGMLVLRVAWPLVPYKHNEFQESATIEVLYKGQIWILYVSQSKVFEKVPFRRV